jgi:hypothetical protein
MGTGPFGTTPAGRFNLDVAAAAHVVYVEDSPKWSPARPSSTADAPGKRGPKPP